LLVSQSQIEKFEKKIIGGGYIIPENTGPMGPPAGLENKGLQYGKIFYHFAKQ
jgi:hypothetical protein